MNTPRDEIYKIQEKIMAIGLSLCRSLPPAISQSMTAHVRESFEANEYGVAMDALTYLEEKDAVDLGADVRVGMEQISALMAQLNVLCRPAVEQDWRIVFVENLRGLTLELQPWVRWSKAWDHDHCSACQAKFSEAAEDGKIGYATRDDFPKGARYEWVCVTCFNELKDTMGWSAAAPEVP